MTAIIQEVKERTDILNVLSAYGVKVNSRNKSVCPFHKEDTPSFTIYPQTQSFYCFGCGVGGDVVSFVEKMFVLDALSAAKKLNEDFCLGLSGQALSKEQKRELAIQIKQREEQQRVLSSFKEWEQQYYNYLCDNIRLMEKMEETLKPKHVDDLSKDFTDYAYAINRKQILEYHWDILYNGELNDKISLYLEVGGVVKD